MKHLLKATVLLAILMVLLLQGAEPGVATNHGFDFANDNAALVIIPTVIPVIYQSVSPSGGDAPLVLRWTTMVATAWFDAVAPYHATAVGAYSDLGRRPATESLTNENMNTAMFYAAYRVLFSLGPAYEDTWRGMLLGVGLDPDDDSTDLSTAVGIGNAAGNAVVAARENDGMNQLGTVDCTYNCQPYADYTGYAPVNSAYELTDPSRWQPDIVSSGYGLFEVQQFVTPQLSQTEPFSYKNPNRFKAPFPKDSQVQNEALYTAQADQVLQVSAALTDEQKVTTELFDDKIRSLGYSILHATLSQQLSLMEFVQLDFVTNVAAFDTAIAIWNQKHKYDAVRPFSAIEYLYGDDPVTAWGGPYQGTVTDLPASEWRSYLQTANHPEYPSASASFCAAHAEVAGRFLGSDDLNWPVDIPQGQSSVEPGLTPQSDITLFFPTWDDFAARCGLSRLWGGVHFYPSIPAGQEIGRQIGDQVYEYTENLIAGNGP